MTDDNQQTVAAVAFEQPVAASAVGGTNVGPTFAEGATATRMVAENAAAGTAVGNPVTATDDHRTALTYMMMQTAPNLVTGEMSPFEIDSKTGQIRVREGAELNYDVEADERTYTITVTVADPDGGTAGTITVTVSVTDVAEAPKVTGSASVMVMEGTATVGVYKGTDEAGEAIGLTLEGADASSFGLTRITSGDDDGSYTLAFNTAPDFEDPADTGSNNEYQLTVAATDRGFKTTQSVVVRVTNMEEAGEIELTPEAPSVGKPVMAELSDEDVVQARTVTWLWSSKEDNACNETTTFERGDRIAGATTDTYTPTAPECLRATARYTDGHGGNKNAMVTVAVVARENNVPMFAEDDPIIRSVNENVAAGMDVGSVANPANPSPVTATDADTDDNPPDTLTYTIVSVTPSSGTARFSIDNTGQLQTEEMLDHEEQASYMLQVKATDSTSNSAMVTVTVMVNDVNENPEIIVGNLQISGLANVSLAEDRMTTVGNYTAVGADASSASWTLEGDDIGEFMIEGSPGMSVMLKFKTSPDYEAPANANNMYMVTLKATDSEGNMAMKPVTVMVTNMDEMGTLVLSSTTPSVDAELTATLTDLDGMVSGETWMWYKSMDGTRNETVIANATSMSYTPVADDAGYYLKVTVTYTDGEGSGKMKEEMTAAAVTAGDPLLAEYDPDGDGMIEEADMRQAVANFFGPSPTLSRADMRRLVGIYFN